MASSLSCSLVAKERGEYGEKGEEVSRGGDRGRGDSTHPLLPCESAICLMTSRSSQNCSLSAYSERLGWDWLVRDCLSASTHATREELGSGGGCPLWNFPVRRPLNVCTQCKCVLMYKLSHDCKFSLLVTLSVGSMVTWRRPLSCTPPVTPIQWSGKEDYTAPVRNKKLYWATGS